MLKQNIVTRGGWIQTGSPVVAEVMASSALFDWICIDLEHGMIGIETVAHLITILELHGVIPVVRVPANDPKWIARCLDAGAKGIIVPMVSTVEEAEMAVMFAKYPPMGTRGFGYCRANGYGRNFEELMPIANDEIAVIVQIEHHSAITNIDGILEVDGVDGTFIGPLDLKGSVDLNMSDVVLERWLDKYLAACAEHDKPAGIHLVNPTLPGINSAIKNGYKTIAIGTDAVLLRQRIEELVS